jgi:hypothetical protein
MLTSDRSFLHVLERWFEGSQALDRFCCHISLCPYLPLHELSVSAEAEDRSANRMLMYSSVCANTCPFFVRSPNICVTVWRPGSLYHKSSHPATEPSRKIHTVQDTGNGCVTERGYIPIQFQSICAIEFVTSSTCYTASGATQHPLPSSYPFYPWISRSFADADYFCVHEFPITSLIVRRGLTKSEL